MFRLAMMENMSLWEGLAARFLCLKRNRNIMYTWLYPSSTNFHAKILYLIAAKD